MHFLPPDDKHVCSKHVEAYVYKQDSLILGY